MLHAFLTAVQDMGAAMDAEAVARLDEVIDQAAAAPASAPAPGRSTGPHTSVPSCSWRRTRPRATTTTSGSNARHPGCSTSTERFMTRTL